MILKAYVLGTPDFGENRYTVRIPYLEDNTSTEMIFDATLCNSPGVYGGYKVGDCVYVSFEGNKYTESNPTSPVIIGRLYVDDNDDVDTYQVINNLKIKNKVELPANTKIGDYNASDIFKLYQATTVSLDSKSSGGEGLLYDVTDIIPPPTPGHPITYNLTGVTGSQSNPSEIHSSSIATLAFTVNSGYRFPDSVTVTGATYIWDKSEGELAIGNPTGSVNITITGIATHDIIANCTNVTASPSNPTTLDDGQTATLVFTANEGYILPNSISISGATLDSWSSSTGEAVISNPTGDITLTIAGLAVYSITSSCTNVTASSSNPTTIIEGNTAMLTFTPNTGYIMPNDIAVSGALYTWSKSTGTLVITSPTSNVIISVAGRQKTFNINTTLTNVTASASNPQTIDVDTTISLEFTPDDLYVMPDNISITGATLVSWNKITGTAVISDPVSNVTLTISAIYALSIPLCFTANTAGSTIELSIKGNVAIWNGQYSIDNQATWITYNPIISTPTITLQNIGDKVYFRGNVLRDYSYGNYLYFTMTGSISASGNCNSLYIYEGFENLTTLTYKNCYYKLFSDCTALTSSPLLPSTILSPSCYMLMFSGCTSLTTPPDLPATTLMLECYNSMFKGCTNLATAPALSATLLAPYCYTYMFQNCSSLATSPDLSATTLSQACYGGMFSGCTLLTTPPELPATTLDIYCYSDMFYYCTSLTSAPLLPATTLSEYCYDGMFLGCQSLVAAPALPATTLADDCYGFMFSGCTSLTTPPDLPATTLAIRCYFGMFSNCTSLTTMPALPATTLAEDCYEKMFEYCTSLRVSDAQITEAPYEWRIPSTGTFSNTYSQLDMFSNCVGTRSPRGSASSGDDMPGEVGYSYTYYTQNIPHEWLCFTSYNEATNSVTLNKVGSPAWTGSYSTDGNTWSEYVPGTTGAISLGPCQKVYFKGIYTSTPTSSSYLNFAIESGSFSVSGNIMSMCSGDNFKSVSELPYIWLFQKLFNGCTNIYDVSSLMLPANTLTYNCYCNLFAGCTNIKTPPKLPATTLDGYCYYGMFDGCTSLITAPALPATTIPAGSYEYMFNNCTALTTPPALPGTDLSSQGYERMFNGCSSLQVYVASGEGHTHAWRIPTNGTIPKYYYAANIFRGTIGDLSTAASVTLNRAFYTQNEPVS